MITREILIDTLDCSFNSKTREIFLSKTDDASDMDINEKSASAFIKALQYLDCVSDKPILAHLLSGGGGEWESGMAIYDSIKHSRCYITTISYGSACSMSSLIPQAADLRLLMPRSYVMLHYGTIGNDDHYKQCVQAMDFQKKLVEIMVDLYISKISQSSLLAGKTIQQVKNAVKKKMDGGDWYLMPEEAVEYNLFDGIIGSKEYPDIESLRRPE